MKNFTLLELDIITAFFNNPQTIKAFIKESDMDTPLQAELLAAKLHTTFQTEFKKRLETRCTEIQSGNHQPQ
jgi:hypothetical protein